MEKIPIKAQDIKKGDLTSITVPSLALRLVMLSYLFVAIPGAVGFIVNSASYDQRLYNEVIFAILPWQFWALAWASAVGMILYYVLSKKYLAFVALNTLLIFLNLAYALMISYAKLIRGIPFTYLSIGLWATLAMIPNTILFINFRLEKVK